MNDYVRMGVMTVLMFIAMYVLMYAMVDRFDNVYPNLNQFYMAGLMTAPMVIIELALMWSMYRSAAANLGIVLAGVLVFAGALWLVRSQETVDDLSYMKAMIPHHSIAIMTSERAHIRDPRVRELADRIIEAQVREIGEMKALIADLERNPTPDSAPDLLSYRERGAPAPAKE